MRCKQGGDRPEPWTLTGVVLVQQLRGAEAAGDARALLRGLQSQPAHRSAQSGPGLGQFDQVFAASSSTAMKVTTSNGLAP